MMFAGFGQWREVWQQRGTALVRSRRAAATETLVANKPASPDAQAHGYLTSDCSLPQGMRWGADGVTEADASMHVGHAGEAAGLSPDHLRSAGAI